MDYLPPAAPDVPDIEVRLMQTPSPVTPGGMKGVGEAGTIGPPAAIGNAVAAALPGIAGRITGTPLTPQAVWSALAAEADREGNARIGRSARTVRARRSGGRGRAGRRGGRRVQGHAVVHLRNRERQARHVLLAARRGEAETLVEAAGARVARQHPQSRLPVPQLTQVLDGARHQGQAQPRGPVAAST
nr:hypothetical protein GCM10020093_042580 [Planobispora longispora]